MKKVFAVVLALVMILGVLADRYQDHLSASVHR